MDAAQTAALLPYGALAAEIARLLQDASLRVPPRLVQPLPGGGSLFVMPASDGRTAIVKLITFTPANAGSARATIQGDVSCSTSRPARAFWCSMARPSPRAAPRPCRCSRRSGSRRRRKARC